MSYWPHLWSWGSVLPPAWDRDVRWYLHEVAAPDMAKDPLTLAEIKSYLRIASDSVEDETLERMRRSSYWTAEHDTRRALIPQTWRQVMDRFADGDIVLEKGPVISIDAVTYLDDSGTEQTLAGSPAEYEFTIPSGPKAGRATLRPLLNTAWPATRIQLGAVVVEYQAGYALSGVVANIPEDILQGRLQLIGEMYKQRSESVHAFNQNPSLIRARDIFKRYTLY